MKKTRLAVLAGMVLAAAVSRLLPHPPNFTPIGAMALFGGAYFADRGSAFLVPLGAMLLSDLVIGVHRGWPCVYGSFALIVCLGFWLRLRRSPLRITGATMASSVLFFVLTNFGVWLSGSLYPKTAAGLGACFVAAVPFFWNTLAGDLTFAAALFGGFTLIERWLPSVREPRPAIMR